MAQNPYKYMATILRAILELSAAKSTNISAGLAKQTVNNHLDYSFIFEDHM